MAEEFNEEEMWSEIREAYSQGEDALRYAVQYFGLTIPDVYIKAKKEFWGPVGYAKQVDPVLDIGKLPPLKEPTSVEIISAHRSDLARARLIANLVEARIHNDIRMGANIDVVIRHLEKISSVYARIIPLERLAYGIDANPDEGPDGITIGKK